MTARLCRSMQMSCKRFWQFLQMSLASSDGSTRSSADRLSRFVLIEFRFSWSNPCAERLTILSIWTWTHACVRTCMCTWASHEFLWWEPTTFKFHFFMQIATIPEPWKDPPNLVKLLNQDCVVLSWSKLAVHWISKKISQVSIWRISPRHPYWCKHCKIIYIEQKSLPLYAQHLAVAHTVNDCLND